MNCEEGALYENRNSLRRRRRTRTVSAAEIELNGLSEREAFTAGFKIAMQLSAEALYGADNE